MRLLILFTVFSFFSGESQTPITNNIINPIGKTIETRFNVPVGFARQDDNSTAFDNYLRSVLLKPNNSVVYTYNGSVKQPNDVYEAVLDIDVGEKDLQQCADAVMRLRAEYLFENKLFSKIHFNFTNGKLAEFTNYADGFRYSLKTNTWIKTAEKDYSHKSFRNYMDLVFNYAGSLSLSRELKSVANVSDIKPGDVFIKGGSPGHAVMVIDVIKNEKTKEILFMMAQSYMPAQNIHVLKNFNNKDISPWYSTAFDGNLKTPEWTFSKNQLMRFNED